MADAAEAFVGHRAGEAAQKRLVEELANDLRARWRRGERPALEDYLDRFPALGADPEAVVDLIYEELLLRAAAGEVVQADEYLDRFPHFADQLRVQFEIHEAFGADGSALDPAPGRTPPALLPPAQLPAAPAIFPTIPGYEIERVLGRGGMGIVYRARQLSLKRPVALKMLKSDAPPPGPGPLSQGGPSRGPTPASGHCADLRRG